MLITLYVTEQNAFHCIVGLLYTCDNKPTWSWTWIWREWERKQVTSADRQRQQKSEENKIQIISNCMIHFMSKVQSSRNSLMRTHWEKITKDTKVNTHMCARTAHTHTHTPKQPGEMWNDVVISWLPGDSSLGNHHSACSSLPFPL